MSWSQREHQDRFTECPGPCNPRNRVCRRSCVDNIVSMLEELPPCVRTRLCQEDLFSVFVKDSEVRGAPTGTDEAREPADRPRKKGKPKAKGGATQTVEEKQVQTSPIDRSTFAGMSSLRRRTQDASVLVRNVAARGARIFGGSRCPCCLISTTVYIGLLLFLAIFARHSPTYQIFLSSQICGILAILSWRISGTIPL